MIITALFNILYLIIVSLLSIFPDAIFFPDEFHNSVSGVGNYFYAFNPILPVTELVTVFSFTLLVMAVYLVIKLVGVTISIVRGNPNPIQ